MSAWAVVKERGWEGMVAKDQESMYRRELQADRAELVALRFFFTVRNDDDEPPTAEAADSTLGVRPVH